ncbi:DUF167 family protein [Thioflexithrix psekupsensis]|uniref:UPF0235 protein TPSD3_04740 n=1 Tax=Thioflexithrix psekupsensis TaxID=1570016 RepID=A0A251XA01_9GAMM|nr:DUF167 family protein [Thioflexithrix psekupsensis]OUD15009.1 YggU family protein [Thioflexithrix psekupsensis]
MSFYHWQGTQLHLQVYIQPRASRSTIVGEYNGRLKIAVCAPPVDGAANAEVIRVLAKQFGVSKQRVTLLSGETHRNKHLCIDRPQQLLAGIAPAL